MPRIFVVPMATALLVFQARLDDATGEYEPEYSVYSVPLSEAKLPHGWDDLIQGIEPTGRIPVADVEFDETRGITLRTMGIERFAKTS